MKPIAKYIRVGISTLFVALCGVSLVLMNVSGQNTSPAWPQWAQNPQHTGFLNVKGQDLNRTLADVIYDPLVQDELATGVQEFGPPPGLLVHYQVPLVDGNDVYMESKAGQFTRGTYSSQSWHQNKFTWINDTLTKIWTFDSDWIAPGSQGDFWEPVYHAVLANGFVYDPGRGGTIFKLNKADGSVVTRINPFGRWRPTTPSKLSVTPVSTQPRRRRLTSASASSATPSSRGRRAQLRRLGQQRAGCNASGLTSRRPLRPMEPFTSSRVRISSLGHATGFWWRSIPI